MVTTRKRLRSDAAMLERVGRATVDAIHFVVDPVNKRAVLQVMAKNLRMAKPDRIEASYNDLVEELPRSICPTVPGVRSVMKLMAELGLNPKAAQMKTEEVIELPLCRRLGGSGT
jgi:hypothetical protein